VAYRLEHPFTGAVYAAAQNGLVEVTKDGRSGIFDMFGRYVSGELRTADPELIRWVGTHGYTPASRHVAGFAERATAETTGADG
jgi:hypothetical protein